MGFGVKWKSWILFCIQSDSFSVLINKSQAGFFYSSLRQSDHLFPFLFIMVSEVLIRMISRAEMGFISGFKVGSGEVSISHLQFADDTIIFCETDVRQVRFLRCFEAVLSLQINMAKSEIYSIGENCDIENLAWLLGCKIGSLSASYLGLPLGGKLQIKGNMTVGY